MPPTGRIALLIRCAAAWLLDRVELFRRAGSFAAIGVVNTAVDFSIFLLGYQFVGLPLVPANIISWTVAATGSYVMNSTITFAAVTGRQLSLTAYGKFLASGVVGLIANTLTVLALSYLLPVLVAKLCAIGVSFLVNFSLSHFVVFRSGRGQRGP